MKKQKVRNLITLLSLLLLASCGVKEYFTAPVVIIDEPKETINISAEKIETDYVYSEYFAVYDTLLISSCPNSPEFIFYIANIRNNKMLGSIAHKGPGPNEFLGLTPIRRIERKGDDLVALTFEPFKQQLIELNISKSINVGNDSIKRLGYYNNPNDDGLTYSGMYQINHSKYLAYINGHSFYEDENLSRPMYWTLEGFPTAPTQGLSIVKNVIRNENSVIGDAQFFSSHWSLSPDNTKIIDAMCWLEQINIINLENNNINSYRVKGSPSEKIFETQMTGAKYQYQDVVCDNEFIYALYFGETLDTYKESLGCYWLHVFDWDGTFVKKCRLPISILKLWMDSGTNTLYGYCDTEGTIFKLNVS